MRVTIYDVADDGTRTKRSTCELAECFPDDPDGMAEALADLESTGSHRCGGGAGPTVDLTTQGPIRYRGYTITYDPPPIGTRAFDWSFEHDDFDGAPDAGDRRCGHAASVAACRAEIDDIEDDA